MDRDLPNLVIHGDNLDLIRTLPDASFQLIYLDPPFNTGKKQTRQNVASLRHSGGSRMGFRGSSYTNVRKTVSMFNDDFDDYWGFLEPRLEEAWRLLAPTGTLYLHLDYRESHYAKVLLDALFGRDCFLNEIIWAYDYGARTKSKWPAKHDNILVYVKDPKRYHFNSAEVDREPYGSHARERRERREWQATDRRLVAHNRLPHRPREDRICDAKAGGRAAAHCAGLKQPGRLGAGFLCRQRNPGGGGRTARAPLRPRRQ